MAQDIIAKSDFDVLDEQYKTPDIIPRQEFDTGDMESPEPADVIPREEFETQFPLSVKKPTPEEQISTFEKQTDDDYQIGIQAQVEAINTGQDPQVFEQALRMDKQQAEKAQWDATPPEQKIEQMKQRYPEMVEEQEELRPPTMMEKLQMTDVGQTLLKLKDKLIEKGGELKSDILYYTDNQQSAVKLAVSRPDLIAGFDKIDNLSTEDLKEAYATTQKDWGDVFRDAYPSLKEGSGSKASESTFMQFIPEFANVLLEQGTKPETFAIWYTMERVIPAVAGKVFKSLPKGMQEFLTKQRYAWGKSPIDKAAKVLKVKKGASLEEINKAYKQQAVKLHPDKPGGSTEAFQELQQAHEILKTYKVETGIPKVSPIKTTTPTKANVIEYKGSSYSVAKTGEGAKPWSVTKLKADGTVDHELDMKSDEYVEKMKAPVVEAKPEAKAEPLVEEAKKFDRVEEFVKSQMQHKVTKGLTIEGFDNGKWRKIGVIQSIKEDSVGFYNSSNPKGYQKYSESLNNVESWLKSGAYRIKGKVEKYISGESIFKPSQKDKTIQQLTEIFNKAQAKPTEAKPSTIKHVKSKGHIAFGENNTEWVEKDGKIYRVNTEKAIDGVGVNKGYRMGLRFEYPAHMAKKIKANLKKYGKPAKPKPVVKVEKPTVEQAGEVAVKKSGKRRKALANVWHKITLGSVKSLLGKDASKMLREEGLWGIIGKEKKGARDLSHWLDELVEGNIIKTMPEGENPDEWVYQQLKELVGVYEDDIINEGKLLEKQYARERENYTDKELAEADRIAEEEVANIPDDKVAEELATDFPFGANVVESFDLVGQTEKDIFEGIKKPVEKSTQQGLAGKGFGKGQKGEQDFDFIPKTEQAGAVASKKVDTYIEEFTIPIGLSTKDVSGKPVTPNKKLDSVSSDFAEVEKRWQEAKGIRRPSIISKAKEAITNIKNSFMRHYPKLPSEKFGQEIDILRQYENIPSYSKISAAHILKGITAPLEKTSYEAFVRNLITEDLMRDVEKGLYDNKGLPFGYKNVEQLKTDYDKYKSIAKDHPDIQKAIDTRKNFMSALKQELVDNKLLHEDVLKDDRYFHHQVLEVMEAKSFIGTGTSSGDVRIHKKGWQKARVGSALDFNTDYLESEFEVISQGISQLETIKTLDKLMDVSDISETLKNVEGGVIPEGYVKWQPEKGNFFYPVNSLTDKIIEQIISGSKEFDESLISQAMAMGRKKKEWIIPQEMAETLDTFKDFKDEGYLSNASRALLNSWKQWILLNPLRVLKYNINNTSGDLDIAMAYNPKILKEVPKATKELFNHLRGKAMTSEMNDAFKRGVIGSGMTISEIPDISETGLFKVLTGEKPNLIQKYWKTIKDFTNFRENILRLASYKYFLTEFEAGKTNIYGASKKVEIDAIKDNKDKAAKLSRELIGDYGNLSEAGQWIRKQLIPFYSWTEVNAPRYVRLLKNIKHEGQDTKFGKGARYTTASAWKIGKGFAKFSIKTTLLYSLVNLWNHTFFPEEEKELSDSSKKQLHIILGKNDDGTIKSLRFQGALSDALEWFSLHDLPQDISDVMSQRVSVKKKVQEMALGPVQKFVQGVRPEIKTGFEVLTGKSLYPDITRPRPIRDKAEHVSRLFSLDIFYRKLTGKPMKSLSKEMQRFVFYNTDPGESSYYSIRQRGYEFLEKEDYEQPSGSPTEKSNTLYYYKQALKFGDEKAAKKWLGEYKKLGGTNKGMILSVKRSRPLAFLPKRFRRKFIESLTKQEQDIWKRAEKWWQKTYIPSNRRQP